MFDIDGWMSDIELNWLYEQAMRIPHGSTVVEIGAWLGRSTGAIATGLHESCTFVTIDTWQGQPNLRDTDHKLAKELDIFSMFLSNMANVGLIFHEYIPSEPHEGLYYLKCDSIKASEMFLIGSISMWFDDGDHTKLSNDISSWERTFKSDCLVCGHDYSPVFQTVIDDVGKYIDNPETIDTIWFTKQWK